jgi:hypothetical protein
VVAQLVECGGKDVERRGLVVVALPEGLAVEGGAVALEVLLLALVNWEELEMLGEGERESLLVGMPSVMMR